MVSFFFYGGLSCLKWGVLVEVQDQGSVLVGGRWEAGSWEA